LYGMLYRDTFTYIGDKELQGTPEDRALSHDGITISLHSRHTKSSTGKVSREEKQCMDQVMFETRGRRGSDVPCTIFLMSDRQQALDNLSQLAIRKYNCTPVVAQHEKGSGLTQEHGPFSGNGFFQDLYYGGKARDGYIGHCGRRRPCRKPILDLQVHSRFAVCRSNIERIGNWSRGNENTTTE
jgi:hypothetical protein